MATFPQRTNISTAVTHHSNIPLRDRHVSTTNFMDINIAKGRELVPDSGIDLDMRTFARFEPLLAPTMGDAIVNTRSYFVPYRTICPFFNDMMTDTAHTYNSGAVTIPDSVPSIWNSVFAESFTEDAGDYGANDLVDDYEPNITPEQALKFDFATVEVDNTITGYDLTAKGRRIMKILMSLGYAIDFNRRNDDVQKSALYLFSLVKVYADHYFPSQYAQSEWYHRCIRWLQYNDTERPLCEIFTTSDLREIYDFLDKVCYDNDYFVSAWDEPNSPNYGASSTFALPSIDDSNTIISNDAASGSASIHNAQAQSNNRPITQFALNSLKALSDYLKRHQISGSRVIDRYLSRWGITLPSEKLNRSVYVSNHVQSVMFGDVTSTADTEGAPLGDYAGKGIVPEENYKVSFNTDEYGFFLILSSVVPITGYYQGEERHVNQLTKLQFFTPEFDNLGTQAVRASELYMPLQANKQYRGNNPVTDGSGSFNPTEHIFGYLPMYAHYKVGRDKLTGDFRMGSINKGYNSWHLFRDLDTLFYGKNVNSMTHDINFVRGTDSVQYNRLFADLEDRSDKIKIAYYFNYTLRWPGRKLYDSYEFTDEDKAKHVTVDVGGSKAN